MNLESRERAPRQTLTVLRASVTRERQPFAKTRELEHGTYPPESPAASCSRARSLPCRGSQRIAVPVPTLRSARGAVRLSVRSRLPRSTSWPPPLETGPVWASLAATRSRSFFAVSQSVSCFRRIFSSSIARRSFLELFALAFMLFAEHGLSYRGGFDSRATEWPYELSTRARRMGAGIGALASRPSPAAASFGAPRTDGSSREHSGLWSFRICRARPSSVGGRSVDGAAGHPRPQSRSSASRHETIVAAAAR